MSGSRLRQVVERSASARQAAQERCDMCAEPIPAEHRHLIDLSSRELMCACRACSLLFDRGAAGGGHFRLVPDRRLRIDDFDMDDLRWENLRIPVDIAFFFHHSGEGRVTAYYPSPAGPTESLLELDAWEQIERANPALRGLDPDVEALLVNRSRGARQYFLVPIEDCYALVGVIRTRWRGLTGGAEVWQEIERFFESLAGRSKEVQTERKEEATWQG
jgi:hypothetical protein